MRRVFFLIFAVCVVAAPGFAQTPAPDSTQKPESPFVMVDQMPEFPGGQAALYKFLQTNIHYPETARENGIQGKVYARFVIERDGSVSNIEIIRSVSQELDAETVRVLRRMPNWTPGMQGGVPVRVYFQLPVSFKMQ